MEGSEANAARNTEGDSKNHLRLDSDWEKPHDCLVSQRSVMQ